MFCWKIVCLFPQWNNGTHRIITPFCLSIYEPRLHVVGYCMLHQLAPMSGDEIKRTFWINQKASEQQHRPLKIYCRWSKKTELTVKHGRRCALPNYVQNVSDARKFQEISLKTLPVVDRCQQINRTGQPTNQMKLGTVLLFGLLRIAVAIAIVAVVGVGCC